MRCTRFLPAFLLALLGCKGRYVLGDVDSSRGGSHANGSSQGGATGGGVSPQGAAGGDSNSNSSSNDSPSASGKGGAGPRFACDAVASQQFDPAHMQAYSVSADVESAVSMTLAQMDSAAKAAQMAGVPVGFMDYQDIQRSPDVDVAGLGTIRGYNYRDGGHGVDLDPGQKNNRTDDGNNFATAFPATSVRAASWDLDLEKRIGEAIGDETAASLNNVLLAPSVDVVRHPYWGRTQEAYGEDTYHTGRMATAFTVGLQEYVLGCAKHWAANNIEKLRSNQNAIMTEQTLREIYGRPVEMVVQDGGIGCVMAAYNMVNGVKSTQNRHLLRDVLKAPTEQGGFGFQGFVLSDWWAMPGDQSVPDAAQALSDAQEAALAGLDVEMPWSLHYSSTTLAQVDPALVNEAARRILTQKYRFKTALTSDGWSLKPPTSTLSGGSISSNQAHEDLAEEAELKSAVLLVNGTTQAKVLPLSAAAASIAVLGPDQSFELSSTTPPKSCGTPADRICTFHFATDAALGDRGTSRINADPARSIGPFDGIMDAAGVRTVISGNSPDAAASADAVVVVVGYTPGDEGEEFSILAGGDRSTLNLPTGQNEFVNSVLDLGKPTVIIVESGSIVNLPWLSHPNQAQATIWAGYPGMRGARALGKLIYGAANFSGKMPMAWPTQAEQDRSVFKNSETSTNMGYFFGYREYDRRAAAGDEVDLVFPFGHGLSYASFDYSNVVVPCATATKDAIIDVSVDITNTSSVDGDEVAMLFVRSPTPGSVNGERPVKELKSFARVAVAAGRTVTAHLPLRIRDLRHWEGDATGHWLVDSGEYQVFVGKNADEAQSHPLTLQVDGD
jgi:beta-glucosidase